MPLSPKSEALSGLYRNCLFRSDVRVNVHDQVAHELADHVLRWKRGAPDAALFKGELNQLTVYALQYGADVEVVPSPFDDFALVHTSLQGGAEIEADGHTLNVSEGRTAILAPRDRLRMRWYAGTRQLIIKIPNALLRAATAQDAAHETGLVPGYLVPRELNLQWDLLVQSLLGLLSIEQASSVDPSWRDHFERNIALFLLAHQPTAPLSPVAPIGSALEAAAHGHGSFDDYAGASRHTDALLEYANAKLSAPVSLEDLANAVGVSVRSLNALCQRHFGVAPMTLLRNMRLDAVRAHLLLAPNASVTETALAYGFGHLGRFSAYYQARFNELPRETQRKSGVL
ncbi:AraC family transcriptional regulator [Trinickia violacea]|uniref:AraC family transcriptional regulator n=1 Tax=Trinickia violacea TaxID=2571746 RepID=A0A4P8ISE4_9BURK|nr:AraC family transcriptional regulator [Trinickia violacea]QCP51952.1 AraC family transcriptional regulator [Trinickia violacea]